MRRFNHTREWKLGVRLALAILIVSALLEIFLHEQMEGYVRVIFVTELGATVILLTDVILGYQEARNKYKYMKKNWIKIVAAIPFAVFFRGASLMRIQYALPGLSFEAMATMEFLPKWMQTAAKVDELMKIV
ncbi:MAG: hypothetical protein ABII22_05125 [Candidatus Micrarchaeota archaeon]